MKSNLQDSWDRGRDVGKSGPQEALALPCGRDARAPRNGPNKPVRIIVGSVPGGGADIMARAAAQRLTERMGKSFVVDNRAGANGIIGIEQAQAHPHTPHSA